MNKIGRTFLILQDILYIKKSYFKMINLKTPEAYQAGMLQVLTSYKYIVYCLVEVIVFL